MTLHTRSATAALNLVDSPSLTESKLSSNVSGTPQSEQVGAGLWRKQKEKDFRMTFFCRRQWRSSFAGANSLGLAVFSMCLGLVIGNMKQQGPS